MKIYDYEERLYSTGDYDLDCLLEEAFLDGYEYFQREFSKEDDIRRDVYLEQKRDEAERKRKKAKGLGIAAGAVGGTGLALDIAGRVSAHKGSKDLMKAVGADNIGKASRKIGNGIVARIGAAPLLLTGAGLGIGALAANSKKKKIRREIDQLGGQK